MKQALVAARARGASLVAVTTADQQAAEARVAEAAGADPCVGWTAARSVYGLNEPGVAACRTILGGLDPAASAVFADALAMARENAADIEGLVFCVQNAHRALAGQADRSVAAVMALRDPWASSGSTLVMLCPSWAPPVELATDVHVIDDPLPDAAERADIAREVIETAGLTADDTIVSEAVRLTAGLSRYAAEQVVALSCDPKGVDRSAMLSRFISTINATPGLRYTPPRFTLDDVVGNANVKAFAAALAASSIRPDAIVWVDEIEKALGGARGDTSGVTQDQLGQLLTAMEQNGASGLIAVGGPGTGKSMAAQAMGAACGVPTIQVDLGASKGSLVGQSEAMIRGMFKTLFGVAPRTFWVATCNNETALPPELVRRFKCGLWYFDLPSPEVRDALWRTYGAKYGVDVTGAARPADTGWTGAEIRNACETAGAFKITPAAAAAWIVPVAESARDMIAALRLRATGAYVSSEYPGAYRGEGNGPAASAPAPKRRMRLGKEN